MSEQRLENYPELEKFMKLYWHQSASNFVEELLQFRKDALSTPDTTPIFVKCMEQMKKVAEAGLIRKKLPQTLQVAFWGRNQRRIVLEDYQAAMKALAETEDK